MEYSKMNNEEKFLASFNNEPNGFAKVISVNGNVILGYIGRFGYAVFEMQNDGYFSNVTDFGKLSDAEFEFSEKKDQTGMMPLNAKIDMVQNNDAKSFLKQRQIALKSELTSLEKWRAIQAKCILENMARKTVNQLEFMALHNLSIVSANNVFNNRFLNVI